VHNQKLSGLLILSWNSHEQYLCIVTTIVYVCFSAWHKHVISIFCQPLLSQDHMSEMTFFIPFLSFKKRPATWFIVW